MSPHRARSPRAPGEHLGNRRHGENPHAKHPLENAPAQALSEPGDFLKGRRGCAVEAQMSPLQAEHPVLDHGVVMEMQIHA